MNNIVAPSILSADFANIQQAVEMLNESKADWIHVDVMDGVFVPNISFGFPVIKAIKRHAKKPLDVHLMIQNPDTYVEEFKQVGADILTVHVEAVDHLHRSLSNIRSQGMKAGVALNPHTPLALIEDVLAEIDLVCMMSVNPGFGGQKFIPRTFEKARACRDMLQIAGSKAYLEIDGGVTHANAKQLVEAGADVLVAGNTVFSADDPKISIEKLSFPLNLHT